MTSVTLSPKYQVVIPKPVRDQLRWRPGQKLSVIAKGRSVYIVPVRPLDELEGFAPGINLEDIREEVDRY